jgi:hypothetical protein
VDPMTNVLIVLANIFAGNFGIAIIIFTIHARRPSRLLYGRYGLPVPCRPSSPVCRRSRRSTRTRGAALRRR